MNWSDTVDFEGTEGDWQKLGFFCIWIFYYKLILNARLENREMVSVQAKEMSNHANIKR